MTLGQVLVGVEQLISKESGIAMSHAEWRRAVGDRVADHTRPGRVVRGKLMVKVASSSWCAELSFLKGDILRKLSQLGHDYSDLSFQVGEVLAGEMSQRRTLARVRPGLPELPKALRERVQQIEDENLRAALESAILATLKRD